MSFFIRDLYRPCVLLSLAGAFAWATASSAAVTVAASVDPAGGFSQYAANRPPLAPSRLVELPFGAVKPDGWLRRQLQLQADGFHGHLTEISGFLKKEKNAWLDRHGRRRARLGRGALLAEGFHRLRLSAGEPPHDRRGPRVDRRGDCEASSPTAGSAPAPAAPESAPT